MSPPQLPKTPPSLTKNQLIELRFGDNLDRIQAFLRDNDMENLQRLIRELEAQRRLDDIDFPHIFHWAAQWNRPSMFDLFMTYFSYRFENIDTQRGLVWRLMYNNRSFIRHVNTYFNPIPFIEEFLTHQFSKN